MDPVEMCGRPLNFYTSLFSPDPTDPGAGRVLWEELPMVSVGDRDQLELPLTLAEFSEALRRMPTNKSPGMDGLTKGDLNDLRNWRPVSLLSTDYKIVAKAMSLRLGSVMADVIHPDQTYTVPGRSIFHNLFLVRDLLELGRRGGLSFALLSLDQEKAFDRVDHGYLLSTLQAFGFGPQFVSFLQVLYASAECLVRLNWTLTEPVSFGRGVRQGCPLSGQLYALAIEPFLCLVPQEFDRDPGDLAQVEACQAIYSAVSSARVNWVKSSGLAVGDWRQASSLQPALQTIQWSAGPLLYLGIYLSATHPSPPENWQNLEDGEIHRDPAAKASWQLEWGDRVYFSHLSARQAGVVTLFSLHLQPKVLGITEVMLGHLMHLHVRVEGLMLHLVNVYALASGPERGCFFRQASAFLGSLDPHGCLVLSGDFNCTLEERDHTGIEPSLAIADVLREIVALHSLVDVWRDHHPDNDSTFNFVRVEEQQSNHSWVYRKARARLFCRSHTRGASRQRDVVKEQLEWEVLELERCLAASPRDPPLCGAYREKREELQALNDFQAQGAFVRSFIHLLQEVDHGSRFFYAMEKKRGAKKHILCLLVQDGTPLMDLVEMRGRARDFYAGLFSLDPTNAEACAVLWVRLPTVSMGNWDHLELPLTLAEFSEALRLMPTNKSPGMDWLTVEFCHVFWDVLGPDLATIWAESLESRVLPLSGRREVLALLLKKGDLCDLWNWRPISLLSMDYKVIAKAISLQLRSVLVDMVHSD
ncbi:unnamed protein product [Caretta caretta]